MRFECGPEWDTRIINIEPKGKIGILMSGGADSFILYELLKSIPDCPHIDIFWVKAGGMLASAEAADASAWDLIETVELLTGRNDIIPVEKFLKHTENTSPDYLPWNEVLVKSNLWIVEEYNLDILYNGTNMNPPSEFFPEFHDENFGESPVGHWTIPKYTKVECPFLHLYKYHIMDLGIKHNIDISQTHSCNNWPTDKGHCGVCRTCLEKQWGFTELEDKE